MQHATEEQVQEHMNSEAANPEVPEEYVRRDPEPASMITLVRGIADLSGGLNMLAMTTNQLPVKALAQLGCELSRASLVILENQVRLEAQMAFESGREESPSKEIDELWLAIKRVSVQLQAMDVGIFTKVKREALEAQKVDAPKVVAIKKAKRKGKVNG